MAYLVRIGISKNLYRLTHMYDFEMWVVVIFLKMKTICFAEII